MNKKRKVSGNHDYKWKAPEHGPTQKKKQEILKDRAKALAGKPEPEETAIAYLETVVFRLANETYVIENYYIKEVYPLKHFTALPCTPLFVLGIINVRGQILSIIDLRIFFDLPRNGLSDLNRVIILHMDEMEFGILADEIIGVQYILKKEIRPPLPALTGIRAEYLKGVTKEGHVVLDAARILADKKIIVHDEVVT